MITNAIILVSLTWNNALPGNDPSQAHPSIIKTRLTPSNIPGEYFGELIAPDSQGYYDLVSVIETPGMTPVSLTEMIMIEEV
jgi:hypothetical protein